MNTNNLFLESLEREILFLNLSKEIFFFLQMSTTLSKDFFPVEVVGFKFNFTLSQMQALRRVMRKREPEILSIKAENLNKGDVINIYFKEAEKIQKALEKGTGVKITIDSTIQTDPIIQWIKTTSKKYPVNKASKKTSKKTTKVVEEEDDEEDTQEGKGGYLPTQPRNGRGLFLRRRMHVAPSLDQMRARKAATTAQGKGFSNKRTQAFSNKRTQRRIDKLLSRGKK